MITPATVPEPPSVMLAALGLAASGLVAWRRSRRPRPTAALASRLGS